MSGGMNIGQAMALVRDGAQVARAGWPVSFGEAFLFLIPAGPVEHPATGNAQGMAFIGLCAAGLVTPWMPTHHDLLANDYILAADHAADAALAASAAIVSGIRPDAPAGTCETEPPSAAGVRFAEPPIPSERLPTGAAGVAFNGVPVGHSADHLLREGGRQAFRDGIAYEGNPHEQTSHAAALWAEGWEEEEQAALDAIDRDLAPMPPGPERLVAFATEMSRLPSGPLEPGHRPARPELV